MESKFTAIIEKDGKWYIAYCPEIPGANGQGKTVEEAKDSLAAAISLILEDRREDALRGLPVGA
jgi:predicted RNase H-like HicB family nuclease